MYDVELHIMFLNKAQAAGKLSKLTHMFFVARANPDSFSVFTKYYIAAWVGFICFLDFRLHDMLDTEKWK